MTLYPHLEVILLVCTARAFTKIVIISYVCTSKILITAGTLHCNTGNTYDNCLIDCN